MKSLRLIDSILFALEQESLFMAFAGDMPLVSPQFIKTMCSIYSGINQVPEPREIGLIIFTALLIVLPNGNQCREVYRVEKT